MKTAGTEGFLLSSHQISTESFGSFREGPRERAERVAAVRTAVSWRKACLGGATWDPLSSVKELNDII